MGIVKFKSKAGADIVMLKPHAENLFSIMGLELRPQGVITPEQMPEVSARLIAAINQEKMAESGKADIDETDLTPQEIAAIRNHVSLEQRAYPLLKLLQAAQQNDKDIHWGF